MPDDETSNHTPAELGVVLILILTQITITVLIVLAVVTESPRYFNWLGTCFLLNSMGYLIFFHIRQDNISKSDLTYLGVSVLFGILLGIHW